MDAQARNVSRETIAHHSKSFAFASTLIPRGSRDEVAVLYTWCRRADDAIDLAPPREQPAALRALHNELDSVYAGEAQEDPAIQELQRILLGRNVPSEYPRELLAGLEMDASRMRYERMDQLLLYCYRVAGTVGLMMSHVLGVRDQVALKHAAHMGMAMQLTNICRDVLEDWNRGRIYIPREVLEKHGAGDLPERLGQPLDASYGGLLAGAVRELLAEADRYYASGDDGLRYLSWRNALAVRTARLVYADIGRRIADLDHDIFAGRAYVTGNRKMVLALWALSLGAISAPLPLSSLVCKPPQHQPLHYPGDVLPV